MRQGTVYVKDLKSLNGTYLRVRDAISIEHDDNFRVGQQIFRLVLREEVPRDSATFRAYQPPAAPPETVEQRIPQDETAAVATRDEP